MTKKRAAFRFSHSLFPAVALTLSIMCTAPAFAQNGSPGTAGASNAAAASDGYGGLGGPTTTGTAPSSPNAGGINGAPELSAPQPSARPNQVPDTAGAATTSTAPQSGTVGVSTGRIAGHTGVVSRIDEKSDPVVDENEKEVSKRIKSICRGC